MKPNPEEWRILSKRLASVYKQDRKAAARQLRQHWHFMEVPGEDFGLVSVHRVIHMHREGSPTDGPRSGQSLENHRSSLDDAGYREVFENDPDFESTWEEYLKLCKQVRVEPSGGSKKPPRARSFFVPSNAARDLLENGAEAYSPEKLPTQLDGSVSQVTRNVYERKLENRRACISHHLTQAGRILCAICDMDFEERYGDIGRGYIHIHHVHPLGEQQPPSDFDPTIHLKPVCPNCHAMLHKKQGKSAFTLEDIRARFLGHGSEDQ